MIEYKNGWYFEITRNPTGYLLELEGPFKTREELENSFEFIFVPLGYKYENTKTRVFFCVKFW